MQFSGLLVSLEGLDGCGKSTQLRLLREHLQRAGVAVVATGEPGGTPLGQQIRELVVNAQPGDLDPVTELTLMFAARAQHVRQVILPALESGRVVLSDRFTDSSIAYQGYGHGVPLETVRSMEALLCQSVRPDLTLWLDLAPRISASRTVSRNQMAQQASSRFEREDELFFERVRNGYSEIARAEPDRVQAIDASASLAEVHRCVVQRVTELLKARRYAHGI